MFDARVNVTNGLRDVVCALPSTRDTPARSRHLIAPHKPIVAVERDTGIDEREADDEGGDREDDEEERVQGRGLRVGTGPQRDVTRPVPSLLRESHAPFVRPLRHPRSVEQPCCRGDEAKPRPKGDADQREDGSLAPAHRGHRLAASDTGQDAWAATASGSFSVHFRGHPFLPIETSGSERNAAIGRWFRRRRCRSEKQEIQG